METHDEREAKLAREVSNAYPEKRDCYVCGGDGWLPSLPEGNSECPYCEEGKILDQPIPRYIPDPDPEYYGGPDYDLARDMERGK